MHDLPINLSVLVYCKSNAGKLEELKGFYNFLSSKIELLIIEQPYDSTKFQSTSIKLFFIKNQ